jgi:hypothetical protein
MTLLSSPSVTRPLRAKRWLKSPAHRQQPVIWIIPSRWYLTVDCVNGGHAVFSRKPPHLGNRRRCPIRFNCIAALAERRRCIVGPKFDVRRDFVNLNLTHRVVHVVHDACASEATHRAVARPAPDRIIACRRRGSERRNTEPVDWPIAAACAGS